MGLSIYKWTAEQRTCLLWIIFKNIFELNGHSVHMILTEIAHFLSIKNEFYSQNNIWYTLLFQCILQHIRCSSGVQIHYNDMFENNDFTKKLLTWPSSSLPLNYCNYNLQAYLFHNPLCSNFKYALSTWMQFFQINTFKNRKSWCGLNHTFTSNTNLLFMVHELP